MRAGVRAGREKLQEEGWKQKGESKKKLCERDWMNQTYSQKPLNTGILLYHDFRVCRIGRMRLLSNSERGSSCD
jgi:hypothetical protein